MSQPIIGASAPPDDLIVILDPNFLDFSGFLGTRAMLEAEGLIPNGTNWPQGFDDVSWQAGKFDYWLQRERPPGAKGRSKQFSDCDWFCLRIGLMDQLSHENREKARRAKELKNNIYRLSPKGEAEWSAQWSRYLKATKDTTFQAFKAKIPGLVQSKRGRKVSPPKQSA